MAPTNSSETKLWGGLIDMRQHQVIQIVLLGVVMGILTWLLTQLLRQIAFAPLMCGSAGTCTNAVIVASNVAGLFVGVVGLLGLVRLSVYRPLLIVLAIVVSLWGLGSWAASVTWYEALSWYVILYALAYIAFSWLVRPRAFGPTVAMVVVAVVIIRLLALL